MGVGVLHVRFSVQNGVTGLLSTDRCRAPWGYKMVTVNKPILVLSPISTNMHVPPLAIYPLQYRYLSIHTLGARSTQQREPSDNARSNFIVLCFSVAVTPKLRCLSKQTSSEPWSVTLSLVSNHLDLQPTRLSTAGARLGSTQACINQMTDITLETTTKILV